MRLRHQKVPGRLAIDQLAIVGHDQVRHDVKLWLAQIGDAIAQRELAARYHLSLRQFSAGKQRLIADFGHYADNLIGNRLRLHRGLSFHFRGLVLLWFRRDVDIVKAFKRAYPSQPEADGERQQQHADQEQQAKRVRRLRIQRGAEDNADAGAQDHQSHPGAAHHRQTVARQFARLHRFTPLFVCHFALAFCMINSFTGLILPLARQSVKVERSRFIFGRCHQTFHSLRCAADREDSMSVNKVLFIRHGQTDFNRERRLQGALPVPLNDCGRRQAQSLAQALKAAPPDAIYASPRSRALETARIIAAVLGQTAHEDERLAEIAFGDFEGFTFAEVEARYPEAYRKWETGYRPYRVPGGESRLDVQRRMEAAWRDIVGAAGLDTVAIVGHSSAMMILLASMFAHLPAKAMKNCSVTTLLRFQDVWQIGAFAETPWGDE